MTAHVEVMDLVAQMKAAEQAFVLATVVRTVSVTAAKAGAKAIIRPNGTIVAGWIGGGCARGAVLKAARDALADGEPRMVSVQPENLLAELGSNPARTATACASRKTCARARAPWTFLSSRCCRIPPWSFSARARWRCRWRRRRGHSAITSRSRHPPPIGPHPPPTGDRRFRAGSAQGGRRFIVVSTQGKGDEAALRAAVKTDAAYHGFVGSRRKMAALREKLIGEGIDASALDRIKARRPRPRRHHAEEIAMSPGGDHDGAQARPARPLQNDSSQELTTCK